MTSISLNVFEVRKDQVLDLIIEKILLVMTEPIKAEIKDLDNKDGILDTINDIADSVQQEFEELISIDICQKFKQTFCYPTQYKL